MVGSGKEASPVFRFFEGLVDPYGPYEQTDTPPRRLWPFLKDYIRPFRTVFTITAILSVITAFADVALIWYVGRLVDLLAENGPEQAWALYGTEMIGVALAILILRPILLVGNVALLHNTILPNFGTMIRWRAHAHVIRQPVGWFESDFAGRIANRIMQTPPAAGDAVFQTFDAVAFASVTVVGAGIMLADADPRLLLPLIAGSSSTPPSSAGRSGTQARPPRPAPTPAPPSQAGWWMPIPTSIPSSSSPTTPANSITLRNRSNTRARRSSKRCASSPRWTLPSRS
jgi:ABC-type multidrug transport system fused ATPase/permease subunit